MTIALAIDGLCAGYGDVPIVHDFSTSLERGSVTTLIGGNGAGKSTLLRAIYGTNRWFAGTIRFDDRQIQHLPPDERLGRGIGFVPQGRCNFPLMSVGENLKMACYTLPRAKHAAAIGRVIDFFPVLARKRGTMAGNLSGGEQQLLETAMVLVNEPRLLLLDEPSLGLSPKTQADVFAVVADIGRSGVTVLIVEQNVHGALLVSDRAIVMELGRKFTEGPAAQVRADPRIREAYLGGNIRTDAPAAVS